MTTTHKKVLALVALGALLIIGGIFGALVYARSALSPIEATELFYSSWITERERSGASPILSNLHEKSLYPSEALVKELREAREEVLATGVDPVLCSDAVPEDILIDVVAIEDARASLVVVAQYEEPVRIRVLATRDGDWWHIDEVDCLAQSASRAATATRTTR